jgi:acyl-CoA thioesterase
MSVTVAPHHLNGHGICHGGVIFTLADSAFAFACNSHNRDRRRAAQFDQLSQPRKGRRDADRRGDRNLTNGPLRPDRCDRNRRDGRIVALFRGASRQIGGTHFPEDPSAGTLDARPEPEALRPRPHRDRQPGRDRGAATRPPALVARHAYTNVAHYRQAFDAAGVHPDDLQDLSATSRGSPSP